MKSFFIGIICLTMATSSCLNNVAANPAKSAKSAKSHLASTITPNQASYLLLQSVESGNLETAKYCLKHGADLKTTDEHGWTPLMEAVLSEQPETVRLLIKAGASVNAKSKSGTTAIEVSESNSIIRILKAAGATAEPSPSYTWESAKLRVDYNDLNSDVDGTGLSQAYGSVVNQCGHTYSYVEIDVNFYDAEGNQVDSGETNTQDLADGVHWSYKVTSFAKNVDHCKIIRIFGR